MLDGHAIVRDDDLFLHASVERELARGDAEHLGLNADRPLAAEVQAHRIGVGFPLISRPKAELLSGAVHVDEDLAKERLAEETNGVAKGHRLGDEHALPVELQLADAKTIDHAYPKTARAEPRRDFIERKLVGWNHAELARCSAVDENIECAAV